MLSTIYKIIQTALIEAIKNTSALFKPTLIPIKIKRDEARIPQRRTHPYKRKTH